MYFIDNSKILYFYFVKQISYFFFFVNLNQVKEQLISPSYGLKRFVFNLNSYSFAWCFKRYVRWEHHCFTKSVIKCFWCNGEVKIHIGLCIVSKLNKKHSNKDEVYLVSEVSCVNVDACKYCVVTQTEIPEDQKEIEDWMRRAEATRDVRTRKVIKLGSTCWRSV